MRIHRASLQQQVWSPRSSKPRSPHLMWYKNSIRLVPLNLFQALIQRTSMAIEQEAGPAQQLTCSPRSSAFMHVLFLMLFAAPDWKSSFPAGVRQVKCLRRQVKFHTGRPPPPHSLPNILLFGAVCASENSSLPQPPPQEQPYLFRGVGFALIVFLNLF